MTENNNQTSTKAEFKQPAVSLAVFNLESMNHLEDHMLIAHQIEYYLNVCGQISLQHIQPQAKVTTVANIFALTGGVLDVLLYASDPLSGEAGIQQSALMTANLIGLIPDPIHEAHARMALRPALGLMAEAFYQQEAQISEAHLKRLSLHLNSKIAGDLETYLKEAQSRLPALLNGAVQVGKQILNSMLNTPSATPGTTAHIAAASGTLADQRDPQQQFSNWVAPLIELLKLPAMADMTPKLPAQDSHLAVSIQQALPLFEQAILQQAKAGQKYSLAWLIEQTLAALKASEEKGNASVPINQTGEYERHTKGETLEFFTLQANALNDPICVNQKEDTHSATEKSISYAIGAERVKHTDFVLPQLGLVFTRIYNSQMAEMDQSSIGARWMMPFSNVITRTEKGYLLIDGGGRKISLPVSILEQDYEVPFEGIQTSMLENGNLVLNFGAVWNFHFQTFNAGQHYHLVLQQNPDTDESVQLDYLHAEGWSFLSKVHFKPQKAKQTLKFAYSERLQIIGIFLDEQEQPLAQYHYDQQGNLVQAIDENGHSRYYEYNHYHQLTRYTDRTGRGQNIRYDSTKADAKAIEEWADDGSYRTRLKWHDRLRQVAVYDAYDVPTYYYFDLDGFTYRTRLADGRESWYSRDKYKRITRQVDFFGQETQQEFNEEGQLIKIVQPNAAMIRFAYDEMGNLVETKDEEGYIWKKEYDATGNIIKEINPLGHVTQYKYNPVGQLTETIDAKGGKKTIQYNDLGQVISYTDCSGKENTWEYDEDGQLKLQLSADQKGIQYLYSEHGQDKGQLKVIIYPDGLKEQFEHDQEGRLLKHIDSKGNGTIYRYNQIGLLSQRIDANGHQIQYEWDKLGRIQRLKNQNGAEYVFEYNQSSQLIREIGFDGEEKQYVYQDNGYLFQIRQPNVITQLEYYEDGKIASKSYIHQQSRHTQKEYFTYDLKGLLARAENEICRNEFYRNALGQVIREHQHYRLPELPVMTAVYRHSYDELGNLIKTIRPDGHEVAQLTYGSGHIYGIALNQQEVVAFKRDDLHRETARYLGNGLVQYSKYHDSGLLAAQVIQAEQEKLGHSVYQNSRHYHYDQNYLLNKVDDSRLGLLQYQYDAIGRLVAARTPQFNEQFSFDPSGNLIDSSTAQVQQVKNNLVKEYQGRSYKYDEQGNVLESYDADRRLKLTWDNLNRLIRSDSNGQITEYAYDVFGRRLYKSHQNQLTIFGWEGDLMVWESVQNKKTGDAYTKHYIYESESFVPLLQAGYQEFISLIKTPDYEALKASGYSIYKDPVWRTDSKKLARPLSKLAYYHCDQVGTPQVLTDEKGECVFDIRQKAWGETLEIQASSDVLAGSSIRFQGQYFDEETGLHYNRYRYYDPKSGRYISKDPIGLAGGLNNSAYVSDPNQWIDPLGLMVEKNKKDPWRMPDDASPWLKEEQAYFKRSDDYYKQQKNKAEVSQIKYEMEQQKNRSNPGVLGALLPGTMSTITKNKEDANVLRNRQGMRNVGTVGAAIATSPYAVASPGGVARMVTNAGAKPVKDITNMGVLVKGGGGGAAGAATLDIGSQSMDCLCVILLPKNQEKWNKSKTGVATIVGGVAGGYGTGMAKLAGVERIGVNDLIRKSPRLGTYIKNNTAATTIFINEQAIGKTATIAGNYAFETNKKE